MYILVLFIHSKHSLQLKQDFFSNLQDHDNFITSLNLK